MFTLEVQNQVDLNEASRICGLFKKKLKVLKISLEEAIDREIIEVDDKIMEIIIQVMSKE